MSLLTNALLPFDLSDSFMRNINDLARQNNDESIHNNYQNTNIDPQFRYYNDDRNLNLTPQLMPNYDMTYKNKSLFGAEKPTQTEHDETPINKAFLKSYYGYTDYGNYNVANQSLP